MLNQVAAEALYSATYVENYLDSVENLPDDVQRHLSRIREIDVQYRCKYICILVYTAKCFDYYSKPVYCIEVIFFHCLCLCVYAST